MKTASLNFLNLIFFFTLYSFTSVSLAQKGKYGASAEDSVKCVENLSVYKDFLRENNFSKANTYWSKAFTVCPGSSLKMYVDGEKILTSLIAENSKNAVRSKELLDTLLLSYDKRVEYFGKEGYVLGKKGAIMLKYNYPNTEAAYNTLKKSVELDGNEAQAAALIYYFQSAVKMNETQPKDAAFWVEIFNQCVAVCDHKINLGGDIKEVEAYAAALDNIVKLGDPFLNCEVLISYFTGKYEEKKDIEEWLKFVANILDQKDCSDDPFFFKVASKLHGMKPSSASAKNMGIMSMKKQDYDGATKYFAQAIELADDETDDQNLDQTLADLELMLSKSYFGAKNFPSARTHAQKAAGYKAGWGEPYMLIGDMYASSVSVCTDEPDGALKAPYWLAVDMYVKAKSIDPSVATDASQKIARYSQYFPSTQDAFFYGVTDGTDYTVKCWINATTKARLR